MSTPESGTEKQNVIDMELYGVKVPAVIDSGADITVLPEELVPNEVWLDETVKVHSYDGNSKVRKLAMATINLGDTVLREKVALVSMSELGGKALVSLPLLDVGKRNVLLSALMKHKSVCEVQTRAMVAKEREEVGEDNA